MTLIMRVSPETSQGEIEDAASEEWISPVRFNRKFPSVLSASEVYWMKSFNLGEAQSESELKEGTSGLGIVEHKPIQLVTPPPVCFVRSSSADDLMRSSSADEVNPNSADPHCIEIV
jgi:hypothetical protein